MNYYKIGKILDSHDIYDDMINIIFEFMGDTSEDSRFILESMDYLDIIFLIGDLGKDSNGNIWCQCCKKFPLSMYWSPKTAMNHMTCKYHKNNMKKIKNKKKKEFDGRFEISIPYCHIDFTNFPNDKFFTDNRRIYSQNKLEF